ncbi:zinc knuckle CX2CX4HX4C containing protein [Tanacetum coccineum]|uniref:Zinc knuckle CX2CX4HX4C containing protein n=1 Tax=Tanacetum coccineum TaxID=301880 RepID=A0ABQ5A4E4_9ASTR
MPYLSVVDAKTNEYANTLYGYFIGRRHAVPIVDSYVNNAWSRFGLQRSMFHHGFFFFQFKTKAGMEQVLAKGPWRIRNVPIMLNIWNPTKKLVKEKVKTVQVWVKLHNVPVVAFSELSLSLITTKVGKPIMLDAHTADMCVNSWGRCSYARVLIEVSAERALVESFIVAVPIQGEEGHSLEKINVEYEWRPPRCGTCKIFDHFDVDCPRKPCVVLQEQVCEKIIEKNKGKKKQPKSLQPKQIEGLRFNKPKSAWVVKSSKSVKPSSSKKVENNKEINDDSINLLDLQKSFNKLRNEDAVLEEVHNAAAVEQVDHGRGPMEDLSNVSTRVTNVHANSTGKKAVQVEVSSSKPKLSFGELDLSNFSDSDDDEVFASKEDYDAYMSSMGGGKTLEDEYDIYDDDYADQIRDLPGQLKEFHDFRLSYSGKK